MNVMQLVGAMLLVTSFSTAFAQQGRAPVGSDLKADFSFELTGPSEVIEGSAAVFELEMTYVPLDLSQTFAPVMNVPNALSFLNFSYQLNFLGFELVHNGDIIKSGQLNNSFRGGLTLIPYADYGNQRYISPTAPRAFVGNDPDTSFTEVIAISLPNLAAGDYKFRTWGSYEDTIFNAPNTACVVPGLPDQCEPQYIGMYTDVSVMFGGFDYEQGFTVTAVPEPETLALLLAGLGVVGAVARRRTAMRTCPSLLGYSIGDSR